MQMMVPLRYTNSPLWPARTISSFPFVSHIHLVNCPSAPVEGYKAAVCGGVDIEAGQPVVIGQGHSVAAQAAIGQRRATGDSRQGSAQRWGQARCGG